MKKKLFLLFYSIVQIVSSIYSLIFVKKLGKEQSELMLDMVKSFPAELQEMFGEVYGVEAITSSLLITAIVSLVIGIILLWMFLKDKTVSKKAVVITLTGVSVFLGLNAYILILGIIAIVLVAKKDNDKDVAKKEKKSISKLKTLKVTGKDLLWVVVLVLFYSTQFIVPDYLNSTGLMIAYEILFYLGTYALVIYIYNKRFKRDFKALKKDFKSYIGYIFKWWGIMLGLSLVAAMIRIVLGADAESANQATLNSAPLWYVGPLAIIWAPMVEEGIFRLGLRRYIKNDWLFIIISAISFGLLHTFGVEKGLYNIIVQSLQYMVMGGVMAYTYTKTNNCFVNMGIHCVQNTFGVILMALSSIL